MLPQFAYLFLMDLTRLQSQTFDKYAAKEPGFADAMLQAYITAFQEPLTQKLTHAFLQTINRIAMSHRGGTGRYKTVANHYKVYFQHYGKKKSLVFVKPIVKPNLKLLCQSYPVGVCAIPY